MTNKTNRRDFIKNTSVFSAGAVLVPSFYIGKSKPRLNETVLGHGDFKYRVHANWGDQDPRTFPIKNCHEMIMDKQGRLIMVGDHTQNNILIFDRSG